MELPWIKAKIEWFQTIWNISQADLNALVKKFGRIKATILWEGERRTLEQVLEEESQNEKNAAWSKKNFLQQ